MMTRSIFFLVVATATFGESSASPQRLLKHTQGIDIARRLERELQFDDLPDICQGFELLIDEIPNGRDSCDCDGISVNCLFKGVCPEGTTDDAADCTDAVEYVVSFENDEITVLSCALIVEGGFSETCAKVALAPDLQLGECVFGTYGGQPCDCDVCEGRGALRLDCSQYDERAVTSCQSAGIGQITPLSNGFNTTIPSNSDSLDGNTMEDDELPSSEPAGSGASKNAVMNMLAFFSSLYLLL